MSGLTRIGPNVRSLQIVSGCVIAVMLLVGSGCYSDDSLTDTQFVERAKEYQDGGKPRRAIVELKNALHLNPDNTEARWLLGRSYLLIGDGASAEKELRRAVELGVTQKAAVLPIAKAILLQGEYQRVLSEAILSPGSPELHFVREKAYIGLGDLTHAGREIELMENIAPDAPLTNLARGLLAYQKGYLEEASMWTESALKEMPETAEALALKADIAAAKGDYATARPFYKKAVELAPYRAAYRIAWAVALLQVNEVDSAITQLDYVLKHSERLVMANHYRAVAAFQKRDYETALRLANLAVEDSGGDTVPSQLIAAAASYALGQYERAYAHLKAFLRFAPNYPPAKRLEIAVQLKLGEINRATANAKGISVDSESDRKLLAAVGVGALKEGDLGSAREYLERATVWKSRKPSTLNSNSKPISLEQSDGERAVMHEHSSNWLSGNPHVLLALTYLRDGEGDKSLEIAKSLQRQRSNDPVGFTLEGVIKGAQGDESSARAAFLKALELRPGDPNANINLAAFALHDGKVKEARERYEAILEEQPDYMQAEMALADLDIKTNDFQAAEERLQRLIEAKPGALEPRLALARLYITRKMPAKALRTVAPIQHKYARNAQLLEVTARAALDAGLTRQALTTARALVDLSKNSAGAHYLLAMAQRRAGNINAALQSLSKVLELRPDDAAALFAQVQLQLESGLTDEAKSTLRALEKRSPDDPSVIELQGRIALAEGRSEDAEDLFRKALAGRDNNLLVIQLAAAQMQGGKKSSAYQGLQNWLERYPDDLLTRSTLADWLLADGLWSRAAYQYRAIIKRKQELASVHNNLAWALSNLADNDAALASAKRAAELAPQHPQILDSLGTMYLRAGNTDKAVQVLKQAVEKSSGLATPLLHLAEAYAKGGNSGDARAILEELLARKESFPERDRAIAILETLND